MLQICHKILQDWIFVFTLTARIAQWSASVAGPSFAACQASTLQGAADKEDLSGSDSMSRGTMTSENCTEQPASVHAGVSQNLV